jgi:hypothetical protein
MQPALEKFKEVLAYESNRKDKVMVFEGTVTQAVQRLARQVIKNNKLELRGDYYSYRQCNGDVFNIDVANKTCNCNRFLDKAACKHLTAACIKEKVYLNGLTIKRNALMTRQRKKANKKDSDDDNSDPDEDAVHEPEIHHEPNVDLQGDERMDTTTHESESLPSEAVKPKRGRPTNAERALRFEKGLTQTKNKIQKPQPNPTNRILRSQTNNSCK